MVNRRQFIATGAAAVGAAITGGQSALQGGDVQNFTANADPVSMGVTGASAVLFDRLVFRRVREKGEELSMVFASFGLALIIRNLIGLVFDLLAVLVKLRQTQQRGRFITDVALVG